MLKRTPLKSEIDLFDNAVSEYVGHLVWERGSRIGDEEALDFHESGVDDRGLKLLVCALAKLDVAQIIVPRGGARGEKIVPRILGVGLGLRFGAGDEKERQRKKRSEQSHEWNGSGGSAGTRSGELSSTGSA